MNTDASGFSLETVWSAIRPHVKDLPFKRLGDYIQHVSPGRSKQIGAVVYYFDLWRKHSSIPGDADTETKAYSFAMGSEIVFHPSNVEHLKAPMSVRFKDLVLVCSSDDSCRWLFQTSDFSPNHAAEPSGYYYKGGSKLVWIEDRDFARLCAPYKGFEADMWNHVRVWVRESMEDRNRINKRLAGLEQITINEVVKFAKT